MSERIYSLDASPGRDTDTYFSIASPSAREVATEDPG